MCARARTPTASPGSTTSSCTPTPTARFRTPLWLSAGVDEWEDYTHMHADYFAANQPVFNDELLDLCLRNAPDSVTFASPRCGTGH